MTAHTGTKVFASRHRDENKYSCTSLKGIWCVPMDANTARYSDEILLVTTKTEPNCSTRIEGKNTCIFLLEIVYIQVIQHNIFPLFLTKSCLICMYECYCEFDYNCRNDSRMWCTSVS